MEPKDFIEEVEKNNAEKESAKKDQKSQQSLESAKAQVIDAMVQSTKANMKHRESTTTKVDVQNDMAETGDINRAIQAINNLAVLSLSKPQESPSVNIDLGQQFNTLSNTLTDILKELRTDNKDEQSQALNAKLDAFLTQLKALQVKSDPDLKKSLANVEKALTKLDMKPQVNVAAPKVTVQGKELDLSPLSSLLADIKTTLSENKPPELDLEPVLSGLGAVQDAITGLRFPVANYVLPFKDVNGKDTQVQLDASGNLPVTGGGGSGGTQYTDGAAPPAHPIGGAIEWNDGSVWQTASTAKPLPVSGSFSSSPVSDVAPATQNVTVVDSSSTSTLANNGQILVTGSPTAGSAASFSISSLETVRIQVSGTWTGTLTSEISIDGGTTWFAQGLHQGAYTTSTFFGNFVGGGSITGATNFRVRATATVTGTAVVKIIESINTNSVYIANAAPAGTIISLLNSSTATLLSGAVFTGAGEDVSNFSEMRVSLFTNVASATDGLSLQQSSDNSNWDVVDTYTIAASSAGQGKTFVVPRQARYFRVVYTNGGTGQTSFRLQSILNRTATAPSSNRASDGYTNETDLVQNQTFPMVYNGTTWDRLRGDATNGEFVQLKTAVPAGTNVIGHVITDSTSTTAVTQTTASNLNATVVQGTAAALSAGWPTLNGEAADTTGTFTNATQTISITAGSLDGYGNVLVSINGTYAAATAVFEGSDDGGTTWYGISEADRTDSNIIESGYTSLTNTSRAWQISNPGWDSIRVRSTAVTSGTVNVRISPSSAPTSAGASVSIGTALPTGANTVGAISNTSFAATQATAASLNATVVGTGTFSVQTTSAVPGTGSTNLGKAEDAGHTSGDTGVMALGVRNDTLAATTNATADYTQLSTDQAGIVLTAGAPRALKANQVTTITSSTAETTIVTAVAATNLDMYALIITNTSATAVNVAIKDGTAGTTRLNLAVPASDTRGFMLPQESAIKQSAQNANWTATSSASVASLVVTALTTARV